MGVVYRARQTEPIRREVALKIVRPGFETGPIVERFETERQTLAMMDHPNIARVLDAGATVDGRPYFVMEFVAGEPITEHCDRRRLSLDRRLELFRVVCEAVQHAHTNAIIHRDLKPSNILVAERDGKPVPKIIDFGVAKALGVGSRTPNPITVAGRPIGTPGYMSPEQAALHGRPVDTRTDVYALGVLLYELLTGTQPFSVEQLERFGREDYEQVIVEHDPPAPS
jgi:serine/threonine protein kinase